MSENSSPAPRKRCHFLRNLVIVVVVLIAALLLFVQFGLGFAVRNGAKAAGPSVIGAPIQIGSTHFRPLSGIVELGGLVVGAPEGFKANVFEMNSFKVAFDPKSLMSDTIVIHEIAIVDPVVSYELSGLRHNIGAILKKLEGAGGKADTPDEKAGEKPAKKVVVERFVFSGAKIRIASTALGGKGAVIPMPTLELRDIGKKSGGATALEVFTEVLGSIAGGILGAVKDGAFAVGGAAVDAVGAVGGAAIGAAGAVGETAAKTVGAVGGAAVDTVGAVGGAAVDSVGAVGGAAVDTVGAAGGAALNAAGAVGGAAVGGVKAVGGAIGSLFGGGDAKTNAPAAGEAPEAQAPAGESKKSTGVMAVGEATVDTVAGIGGAAVKTVGAVGGATLDTASAIGGAAVGGVKTVGGAAVGGVKAVGGAAVGGVKAVGGAIGGIFGGGDKAATNATESAKPE